MENSNLGIGGNEVKQDAFEAFQDISPNRTLVAQKLTSMPPVRPEVVTGLTSVEDVFTHYKPNVEVAFENEMGGTSNETLHFSNVGDFGVKGITRQSKFLGSLDAKQAQYQKIMKQLKTNKLLKSALASKDGRDNVVGALQSLLSELKNK